MSLIRTRSHNGGKKGASATPAGCLLRFQRRWAGHSLACRAGACLRKMGTGALSGSGRYFPFPHKLPGFRQHLLAAQQAAGKLCLPFGWHLWFGLRRAKPSKQCQHFYHCQEHRQCAWGRQLHHSPVGSCRKLSACSRCIWAVICTAHGKVAVAAPVSQVLPMCVPRPPWPCPFLSQEHIHHVLLHCLHPSRPLRRNWSIGLVSEVNREQYPFPSSKWESMSYQEQIFRSASQQESCNWVKKMVHAHN